MSRQEISLKRKASFSHQNEQNEKESGARDE
jgi:hypothetical protein